ncbi:glycosyltransferase [Rheinheimera aquimaris]|uniref:glycosyltransferase n=1 Tax=Rheinheimera aquimaris TaxID=412437 RepID=UPI0026A621D5
MINKQKVAVIVDEFTLENLKDHWHIYEVNFNDPLERIEQFEPSLLFVESVWSGVNGSWQGLFGAKSKKLRQLVEFCQERKIPTVFWNKEDPVHFDDFTERCDIVGLFDFIFSSELDCVGDYAEKYPDSRCFVLPFFYNENKYQAKYTKEKPGFFFAGTYYKKFAERNVAFEKIVDYLAEQGVAVSIYDRHFGCGQKDLEFPEKYKRFLKGTVSPADMVFVYQNYEHCINLNTVQNGQTMFARRVIECLACATPVLSNYSRALDVLFKRKRKFVADNMVEYIPIDCSEAIEGLTSKNAVNFIESVVLGNVQSAEGFIAKLNSYAGYKRTTLQYIERSIVFTEAKVSRSELSCYLEDERIHIHSSLAEDLHGYINFSELFDVHHKKHVHFLFDASSSSALLDIWFLDAQGELIFRNVYSRTQEISIGVPTDAVRIKVAVRVAGSHDDLICKLAFGKKIKIPQCILPLNENYCFIQGEFAELKEKLSGLPEAGTEVMYYTGNDFDFSYHVIHGHSVVVGGELVKSAVEAGRLIWGQ